MKPFKKATVKIVIKVKNILTIYFYVYIVRTIFVVCIIKVGPNFGKMTIKVPFNKTISINCTLKRFQYAVYMVITINR